MTDTTDPREGKSEHAELLRDLDSAAHGIQRLDRLDAESAAKAIRALEAKVRELRSEGTLHSKAAARGAIAMIDSAAVLRALNATVEQRDVMIAELRADRDRLAGEVERLQTALEEREHVMHARIRLGYDKTVADSWRAVLATRDAEVDRLTAELAGAREDAEKWEQYANTIHEDAERMTFMTFHRHDGLDGQTVRNWVDQRSLRMTYRGAIDAARAAGEGEK